MDVQQFQQLRAFQRNEQLGLWEQHSDMGVERNNGRLCTGVDEHLQSPDDDVQHIQYLVDANVQQSDLAIQLHKHRYVLLERLLYLCEQYIDVDVERDNGHLCTSVDEHLQSPDDDVEHIQHVVIPNVQQLALFVQLAEQHKQLR
jgi:hypothetical protein